LAFGFRFPAAAAEQGENQGLLPLAFGFPLGEN
jgi:hypothetical protein